MWFAPSKILVLQHLKDYLPMCGSLLTVGMIWRLQWSGTCNDIVNTLQPTCHQLSSANGSPVNCVIIQSGVRRQKPAVTCEEEPFQGCNAATKPPLHIFLLTFGHFMPVYVLLSRCSEHVATALWKTLCDQADIYFISFHLFREHFWGHYGPL